MDTLAAARAQMGMSLAFHMVLAASGIGMPLLHGPHQSRCAAHRFLRVDIGLMVEEKLDRREIAIAGRKHEGSFAAR